MNDFDRLQQFAENHNTSSKPAGADGSFGGEVLRGVIRAILMLALLFYGAAGLITHDGRVWFDFWRTFGLVMILGSWGYLCGTIVIRLIRAIKGKPFEWRKAPRIGEMVNGWIGVGLLLAPWIPGLLFALIFHGHGHAHAFHPDATVIFAIVVNVLFFGSIIGGVVFGVAKRRAGSRMGVQTHVPQTRDKDGAK